MMDGVNKQIGLMERALDAYWLNNEVISNNIANSETPGYKKYRVSFEALLNEKQENFTISSINKNPKFLPIGKDRPIAKDIMITKDILNTSMRKDGNNVDIDEENAELAKNSLKYDILASQLAKEISLIKQAINEGR